MSINTKKDIAVIGMSGVLPGVNKIDDLWGVIKHGKRCFSSIPQSRWDADSIYSDNRYDRNKSYSKWICAVDNPYSVDIDFMGLPRSSVDLIDPQQRLLIEQTQHCIEDAVISLRQLQKSNVMVSIGAMDVDHQLNLLQNSAEYQYSPEFTLGTYQALLANRISFHYKLKGESKCINAACASSGLAIHDARKTLQLEECEYALVGAVNLCLHPYKYLSFSRAGMLSPKGQCSPFDASADGYVPGEGAIMFLLTTVDTAIKKNHNIRAVIKGSAANHNGANSSTITSPSSLSQCEVINQALVNACMEPKNIGYIEAHGTGTSLGDPIEVDALSKIFGEEKVYVSSLKGNIGHLESAAGMAGIAKAILLFKNRQLPANSWIKKLNPLISDRIGKLDFLLNEGDWGDMTEKAIGISSFGFGGANTHIVLDEWRGIKKSQNNTKPSDDKLPILISAKSKKSLDLLVDEVKAYCDRGKQNVINYSFASCVAKSHYKYKKSLISRNGELIDINEDDVGNCSDSPVVIGLHNDFKVENYKCDISVSSTTFNNISKYIDSPIVLFDYRRSDVTYSPDDMPRNVAIYSSSEYGVVKVPFNIIKTIENVADDIIKNSDYFERIKDDLMNHQMTFTMLFNQITKMVSPGLDKDVESGKWLPIFASYFSLLKLHIKWDLSFVSLSNKSAYMQIILDYKLCDINDIYKCLMNKLLNRDASAALEEIKNKAVTRLCETILTNAVSMNVMYQGFQQISNVVGGDGDVSNIEFVKTESLFSLIGEENKSIGFNGGIYYLLKFWENGMKVKWDRYLKDEISGNIDPIYDEKMPLYKFNKQDTHEFKAVMID